MNFYDQNRKTNLDNRICLRLLMYEIDYIENFIRLQTKGT